jgi:hypothetical protein
VTLPDPTKDIWVRTITPDKHKIFQNKRFKKDKFWIDEKETFFSSKPSGDFTNDGQHF